MVLHFALPLCFGRGNAMSYRRNNTSAFVVVNNGQETKRLILLPPWSERIGLLLRVR
jgi:hypothetical protein